MKLNREQKRLTADILGNIAVGWFVVGVIAPVFTQGFDLNQRLSSMIFGSIAFVFFYLLAIYLLRK